MDGLDFFEPADITDVLIDGVAKIEPTDHGLVRVYLYGKESLSQPMKIIRSRHLIGLERAIELNTEVRKALLAIHRQINSLRLVL